MSEYHSRRSGGAATYHMLVASANIGRNDLQNYPMFTFSLTQSQLWIINFPNLYKAWFNISNSMILTHNSILKMKIILGLINILSKIFRYSPIFLIEMQRHLPQPLFDPALRILH